MYDFLSILKNNFIICRLDWTAIFTATLAFIALWQLRKINRTSGADFLHRFKNDFFNEKTRLLMILIEYNCLKYINLREIGIPYFEISLDNIKDKQTKKETKNRIQNINNGSYIIDVYEMDDLLLGHFEDMGLFNKNKVIADGMIYEEFSTYIKICWENDQIREYINHTREDKEDNWDLYDNFEYIYNKCEKHFLKKRAKSTQKAKPPKKNPDDLLKVE